MYNDIDSFVTLSSAFGMIEKERLYDCDDLTFIIPYGTDLEQRRRNFGLCLLNALFNTNAKIKVYWSETEKGLGVITGQHAVVENIKNFFENNSSAAKLKNCIGKDVRISDRDGRDLGKRAFEAVFIEIVLCPLLDSFRTKNSLTVGDMLAEMTGQSNEPNSPLRARNMMNDLRKEVSKRLSIYVELREQNEPFHRMKYLNKMLESVETPFTCNLDADVLITRSAVMDSIEKMRRTDIDFIYPYSDIDRAQIRVFPDQPGLSTLIRACVTGDFVPVMARVPHFIEGGEESWGVKFGLAFFARTESYKKAYGENENFVSWGPEDCERYHRFCKLGFKVGRVLEGYVFHIEHPRSIDSGSENPHFKNNLALWKRLQGLDAKDMIAYYENLDYVKQHKFG